MRFYEIQKKLETAFTTMQNDFEHASGVSIFDRSGPFSESVREEGTLEAVLKNTYAKHLLLDVIEPKASTKISSHELLRRFRENSQQCAVQLPNTPIQAHGL